LLEAAGEVFADRGFRDATIQDICRRADANIAAVHYHFGDKEQLYRTVIQYAEERAAESAPADVAPDAPAEKRLRAHIESFLVRLFDERQSAWLGKLMVREMSEPTPGFDVIVHERTCGVSSSPQSHQAGHRIRGWFYRQVHVSDRTERSGWVRVAAQSR